MSNFSDEILKQQKVERDWYKTQQEKFGEYDNPENGCPNCGRHRVMIGDDKKHRCEKCHWCIEDNQIDPDFARYDF